MGYSCLKWIKELAGETAQRFPALIITGFFGIIYILEKILPGSFYAVISALLGAGILCVFQVRQPSEPWLGALQRLPVLLGFAGDIDDGFDDGNDGRPQTVADSRSPSAAARSRSGEQKDGADPSLDENHGPQRGGQGSCTVGDADGSAAQERQLLDIGDSGADGLIGDGVALMGDWFENLSSQDRAAAEAGAHVAMSEDVEKTDPVDKARLDLLFRYLASMEGGNKDQAHSAPASAQRQKLQRKLLLRTAGLGESSRATKNAVKADDSENAGQDVQPSAGKAEDLLEDSVKIEALLRELGEDSSKLNSASLPKAPTKAKKAKPMPRRKGAATSAPARGSSKEELVSVCSKATSASASRPSPDIEKEDAIEVGLGHADSRAQAEMSLEEAAEFEVEAQVVANRKARRKSRKESDVVVAEAPRSRASSGETLQAPKVVEPKPVAVPAAAESVSTEGPPQLVVEQANAATHAQPAEALGISTHVEDSSAAEQQTAAITPSIAEPVAITGSIAEIVGTAPAPAPMATVPAAKLDKAAADTVMVPGPSTIIPTTSQNVVSSSAPAERQHAESLEIEVSASPGDAEAEEEMGEDGEDWEWQCPDGFPLQSHTCETPTLCGSCGEMQPQGSAMQLAVESGWAACEECIHIAFNQPVEATGPQQAGMLSIDPSRMTALEIATWFQDRGAENDLRQCMMQVAARQAC